MGQPNCSQCRHFYITWDQKTPHGCRRFGIQCKDQPSKIVNMAGLGNCQGFEPKKRPEPQKKGQDLNRNDLW
jgi:hypothetical protein